MSELLQNPEDYATKLAEAEREHNMRETQRKVIPKQVKGKGGKWPEPDCIDCGVPIDKKRLEATGSNLCIECATLAEKKQQRFGRAY